MSHLAVGKTVDPHVAKSTVEAFLDGERLGVHPLLPAYARNRSSTHAGGMPGGKTHGEQDAGRVYR